MQSFIKDYFNTLWASKFSTRLILSLLMSMIKCFQITQSKKFAMSLQYLKKEVRNGDHFWHADKRQIFHNFLLFFLMEVSIHVQNTQNRKLVIFSQYIRKNIGTALWSIVIQKILIFYRDSITFDVTCFSQIGIISIIEIQSKYLRSTWIYLYRFYQTDISRNH